MSLIKLSGLLAGPLESGAKKIGLGRIGSFINKHPNIASGAGLTVGLGAAEGAVGAMEAKPGERTKGALKGVGKGLVEGAVLGAVEPHVTNLVKKKVKLPTE